MAKERGVRRPRPRPRPRRNPSTRATASGRAAKKATTTLSRAAAVVALLAAAPYARGFAPPPPSSTATRWCAAEAGTAGGVTEAAASSSSSSSSSSSHPPDDWKDRILSSLSSIIDPDLNADIVSLGFVRNLKLDDSSSVVSLDLELTTPACPVKDEFVRMCRDEIDGLEWTRGAEVTLTARPAASQAPGVPLGMSRIRSVVAVSSCKGGVGKSTTAVNLAFSLSKLGAKVGIFDADVYGPSLPTMVAPTSDDVRFVGRQIAPLEREGVKLMSFGYVNEGSAIMRGPMVTQLLDQFLSLTDWGELDYLIVDMPPGTGDVQLTLTQKLDLSAAVVVTTPQELSFVDVERGVEMFDSVEVPCVAVVENMAYLAREDGEGKGEKGAAKVDEDSLREKFREALTANEGLGGDEASIRGAAEDLVAVVRETLAKRTANGVDAADAEEEGERIFGPGHRRRLSEQFGIETSYSVPLMGTIARNGDAGTPYVLEHPDAAPSKVYAALAESVVKEVAKVEYARARGWGRPRVSYDEGAHRIVVEEAVRADNGGEGGEEAQKASSTKQTMDPATLRRACRCAACVEELSGRQILDPASISEDVRPLTMAPTGNYALSVDWSDGHRSLYPYRQMRSILAELGGEETEGGGERAGSKAGAAKEAKEEAAVSS
ncbi:hypothetical protein ACHAWF_003107 [Thalassiosira exigua]